MDEEKNDMRGSDFSEELQKGKQTAGNIKNKISNGASKLNQKRKTIRGAKTGKKGPGQVVGRAQKIKGQMYKAKGASKTAAGTGMLAAGTTARATGMGLRGAAQAIKGAGTLASLIPFVGPAIGSVLKVAAQTVDKSGKTLDKFGKKTNKQGKKAIKSGKHDIKRGTKLEKTGEDIGDSPSKGPIGNIGKMPTAQKPPNPTDLIKQAISKIPIGKNPIFMGGIIIGGIILLFICILLLFTSSSENNGSYSEGDESNVPYVIKSQVMSEIDIVSNGAGGFKYVFKDKDGNIISLDEAITNSLTVLKENNSTAMGSMGNNDDERREILKKMIQAELVTQYPNLNGEFNTNDEISGGVLIKRKDEDGSLKILKYMDEATFNQLITSADPESMNYYTLKKVSSANGVNSFGGSDILNDWVASWENGPLFLYKKGQCSYDSNLVRGYITEDGQNYICRTDEGTGNGTYNYGFGVCVYNPRETGGWMHVQSFSKYGIDITKSVLNETKLSVEIVDKVKTEELLSHKNYINGQLTQAAITLNDDQLNALTGIAYQFGDAGANIPLFIDLYRRYGNTDELKENYHSQGGAYLFKHVPGGTNQEGIDRAAANWGLFHDGIYYAGSGGTLNKNSYGGSNNNISAGMEGANYQGSNHQEIAWNFFKSQGLSDVSTAAIIGNLMQESSSDIDPTADNGSHRGIAQWDYSYRYEGLRQYANSINSGPDDFNTQLQYLWLELNPSADHTYAHKIFNEENFNAFTAYTDVAEAAKYFSLKFEVCSDALSTRQSNAQSVLQQYGGTEGSTNGTNITTLNNFLFIGDSRYSTTASQISSLGSNIKNEGVGSATIEEWLNVAKNGGTGTVQSTSVNITGTYSGISVQLGANSVYGNVGNATSQMKEFLQKLKELHPNTPIFVNSCMNVNPDASNHGYSWDAEKMRDNINQFNNDMNNYCSQIDNLYYVLISDNLLDENGYVKSEYLSDGLHCNSSGAEIFANNIKKAILNSGTSGSNNPQNTTTNGITYSLVVANKKTVVTTVVDNYTYSRTYGIDTSTGTTFTAQRFSETPAPEQVNTSTVTTYSGQGVDYQTALKNYTLYFDFLWAMLINSGRRDFIMSWADLAIKDIEGQEKVCITTYSDVTNTDANLNETVGEISKYKQENKKAIVDVYNVDRTTSVSTTDVQSKCAITYADTWLLKYENNAETYAEYEGKSKEIITEKLDENSDEPNIVKLIGVGSPRAKTFETEKYLVDRMIGNNEKVSFMSDIWGYILDITNQIDVENRPTIISDMMSASSFDLRAFNPTGSNQYGNGIGSGATGGNEQSANGVSLSHDGYETTFSVGDRTYKNYKQTSGYYVDENIPTLTGHGTIRSAGCAITSIAVICSGYGIDIDPHGVVQYYNSNGIGSIQIALSRLIGKSCEWTESNVSQAIKNQLKAGKPCIVHTSYYSQGHYLCVLAISDDDNYVYLSDVGGVYAGTDRNGWQPIGILSRFDNCLLISD